MPNSISTENIMDEIIDKLAVGNYIIQIGSIQGASVNVATREEQYSLRLRPTPILMPPRPVAQLLSRLEAVQEALNALESGQSVEFHSPTGFGKTFLLRCLTHDYGATLPFPDGIISLSPVYSYVGDILQFIWEAFYETNVPYKPTNKQICQQIQDKRALIVLDEDKLIKYEIEELMNAATECTFLLASSTSRIQEPVLFAKRLRKEKTGFPSQATGVQRGRSILLSGISDNDALALVEEELQRSLTPEELPFARSLCTILLGNPMHLQLAIASVLFDGISLAQFVSQLPPHAPSNYLIQQIVASLSPPQRNILALLAMMDGVGIHCEQVIAIAQIPDALTMLEELHRRHLVQFDGCYSVSQTIIEGLPTELKATAPQDLAIAYFTNRAELYRQQPKNMLAEIDAMAQILDVAVKANRWGDVLRLVKAVEGGLALSRRWSLWKHVLQRGLQASQAEQDQVAEAWALHQLGTCALCLSENADAINYLTKAIQLRESLGDERGVSATRHNLDLLKILNLEQTKLHSGGDSDIDKTEIFSQKATDVETPLPQHLTEDSDSQLSSSPHLLTRMNIVIENASPSDKPNGQGVFLLPTGVITTAILAAGGLLTWVSWHQLTQVTSLPSTMPTATATRSPLAKGKPKAIELPLPIAKPTATAAARLSPIIASPLTVDPPLKLPGDVVFEKQIANTKSKVHNRKSSKSRHKSAPVPKATSTPTVAPTATTQLEQPALTPTTKSEQQTSQLIPTPTFTQIPTPIATPTVEATPTATFTPAGILVPTQH